MKNNTLVKYTTVAVMIGLFSPSIQIKHNDIQPQVTITILQQAEARRTSTAGNRNVNRNVNKNVNVNVNHRYYGGHRSYGHYHGHPILAFTAGMAIGSIISASTMPKTCNAVRVNNVEYKKCDNSYYQPFYEGDTLVYKVVESPY